MGKWARKLWIGLLSGTAALAACNLSSPPPCYYGPPSVDPREDTTVKSVNDRRAMLRQRIQAINGILEGRRNAEIYGTPEMIEEYERENMRLSAEVDSLEKELKNLDKK